MNWDEQDKYVAKIPQKQLEQRGFIHLGSGRHRRVFQFPSGKYVIKFPINENGEAANVEEYELWKNKRSRLAKCRLIEYNGTCCLVMERVEYPDNDNWYSWASTLPDWTSSVDCRQVGYNRKGELVAFDYSRI